MVLLRNVPDTSGNSIGCIHNEELPAFFIFGVNEPSVLRQMVKSNGSILMVNTAAQPLRLAKKKSMSHRISLN